ncbi:unnamed protein product [Lepidochelys kempii]
MQEQIRISTDLTPNQKKEVTEMINRYRTCFQPTRLDHRSISPHYHRPWGKGNFKAKKEEIKAEVKRMLELGVIEESQSQGSSPIVLVPKPDGTTRFCNDFRRLNEISKFDAYPIP